MKKDMLNNIKGIFVVLANSAYLIKHEFMEDYWCWNKHGEERLNEVEMMDSYMEREISTGVKEDHDYVNETDILGFTDDNIEF
jgi:hypothetical protein